MAYIVKAFTPGKLNLAPETLEEEVLQNVAIIVSTPKFSVPLDRGLGLAQRFIDKPIQVAQSILISEVLDAVEEYEPRAEVTKALNAIAGIESRVSRVEDGLFNNITGNPFLASFDSLDGITLVKGIWNEERKRIEC